MDDSVSWQPLLRDSLAMLALPTDEQIRVNGPGCVACDLLNDFELARTLALENAQLSEKQLQVLDAIDGLMQAMEESDYECFNNEVLYRPVWQQLRLLAPDALAAFGWETTAPSPFIEVKQGVWHRPSGNSEPNSSGGYESS